MNVDILRPRKGSTHRKKRVGRGPSSGHGKTSTRGHKGQRARGSGKTYLAFEGGQMPLVRRLPKRGFRPLARCEYTVLNVGRLNSFLEQDVIDPEYLRTVGLLGKSEKVKILGEGMLERELKVVAHAFSRSAREKIEKAGGQAEVLEC